MLYYISDKHFDQFVKDGVLTAYETNFLIEGKTYVRQFAVLLIKENQDFSELLNENNYMLGIDLSTISHPHVNFSLKNTSIHILALFPEIGVKKFDEVSQQIDVQPSEGCFVPYTEMSIDCSVVKELVFKSKKCDYQSLVTDINQAMYRNNFIPNWAMKNKLWEDETCVIMKVPINAKCDDNN